MKALLLASLLIPLAGCSEHTAYCRDAFEWHKTEFIRENAYGFNQTVANWHEDRAEAFWEAQQSLYGPDCRDWLAYRFYPGQSEPSSSEAGVDR